MTKIYKLATKIFLLVASWLPNEKVNFKPWLFSTSLIWFGNAMHFHVTFIQIFPHFLGFCFNKLFIWTLFSHCECCKTTPVVFFFVLFFFLGRGGWVSIRPVIIINVFSELVHKSLWKHHWCLNLWIKQPMCAVKTSWTWWCLDTSQSNKYCKNPKGYK